MPPSFLYYLPATWHPPDSRRVSPYLYATTHYLHWANGDGWRRMEGGVRPDIEGCAAHETTHLPPRAYGNIPPRLSRGGRSRVSLRACLALYCHPCTPCARRARAAHAAHCSSYRLGAICSAHLRHIIDGAVLITTMTADRQNATLCRCKIAVRGARQASGISAALPGCCLSLTLACRRAETHPYLSYRLNVDIARTSTCRQFFLPTSLKRPNSSMPTNSGVARTCVDGGRRRGRHGDRRSTKSASVCGSITLPGTYSTNIPTVPLAFYHSRLSVYTLLLPTYSP